MAKTQIPYSRQELFARGPQPTYTGRNLDEIAFPLGGIGAGMVTLGGWGQLRDWEIRNRPAKGSTVPEAFFTIQTRVGKNAPITKVIQGPVQGGYTCDGHSLSVSSGRACRISARCRSRGRSRSPRCA